MTGVVPVIPRFKFTDPTRGGGPLSGGSVTVYLAGTTTLASVFQDKALTIAQENPVPLDANGEALFWVDSSRTYKFLAKDDEGATVPGWPVDDIPGGADIGAAATAASEWATKTSGTVDGVLFSSKEYAQGAQASTGGSAKNWAQQTGADVTGASANSRSAKSWAQDNLSGATLGGSAKDWAQSATLPDGSSKSAKTYAADAATARDAALATTRMYATTAAAIADAGLANLSYFTIPGTTAGVAASVYQKSGGVAVDTGIRLPNTDLIPVPLASETGYIWGILDSLSRIVVGIEPDGTFAPVRMRTPADGIAGLVQRFATHAAFSAPSTQSAVIITADEDHGGSSTDNFWDGSLLHVRSHINPGNGAVTVGDSIAEQNSVSRALYNATRLSDAGAFVWGNALAGYPLEYLSNLAVGGTTTTQLIASQLTAALALRPRVLVVNTGINDARTLSDADLETVTLVNLRTIYEKAFQAGCEYVIDYTVTPIALGHADATAAIHKRICRINEFKRQYEREHRNFLLVDAYKAIVDHSSNGNGLLGVSATYSTQPAADLHPSAKGARLIGQAFATRVSGIFRVADMLAQSQADNYTTSSGGRQLYDNPFMLTGTGLTVGSSLLGSVMLAGSTYPDAVLLPNGSSINGTWGAGTIFSAVVARSDGYGNDWKVQSLGAPSDGAFFTARMDDVSARITYGDQIRYCCALSITGANKLRGIQITVQTTMDGVTFPLATVFEKGFNNSSDYFLQDDLAEIPVVTPWLTIGSSGTIASTRAYVRPIFDAGGVATIRFGRQRMERK